MRFLSSKATWRSLVGVLALAEPVWRGFVWLLGWAGNIDFVAQHLAEPGWVGVVVENLLNPPPWALLALTLAGLGFIAWDAHRAKPTGHSGFTTPNAPPRTDELPTTASTDQAAVPTGRRLYVGRVHVDANRLESDFLLEFAFIAFNGGPMPLRRAGLRGRIAYCGAIAAQEADWVALPTPAIRDDNPDTFAPFTEFMVVISQSVPGALAARISDDLATGERVMFVFEGLSVAFAAEGQAEPARLPVWPRATCERTRTAPLVMPIATGRIDATL